MNELTVFNYNEMPIRTVDKDGEPWWVLADVCKAVELSNPRNVTARLDEDEKGVHLMDTPGGVQDVTIINEPGLYNLILRSAGQPFSTIFPLTKQTKNSALFLTER